MQLPGSRPPGRTALTPLSKCQVTPVPAPLPSPGVAVTWPSAPTHSFSSWKRAVMGATQAPCEDSCSAGPPPLPFHLNVHPEHDPQCPREWLLYSPFSLKNPQLVTQQDWDTRGGPAENWGRQLVQGGSRRQREG